MLCEWCEYVSILYIRKPLGICNSIDTPANICNCGPICTPVVMYTLIYLLSWSRVLILREKQKVKIMHFISNRERLKMTCIALNSYYDSISAFKFSVQVPLNSEMRT